MGKTRPGGGYGSRASPIRRLNFVAIGEGKISHVLFNLFVQVLMLSQKHKWHRCECCGISDQCWNMATQSVSPAPSYSSIMLAHGATARLIVI